MPLARISILSRGRAVVMLVGKLSCAKEELRRMRERLQYGLQRREEHWLQHKI